MRRIQQAPQGKRSFGKQLTGIGFHKDLPQTHKSATFQQKIPAPDLPLGAVAATFRAFVNDPPVTCDLAGARALFDKMLNNTKHHLGEYFR